MALSPASDIRLSVGRDMTSAEHYQLGWGQVAVYTAAAPHRDTGNEDAAVVIPVDANRAVLAVADGLGGQPSGAEASELALRTLADRVIEEAGAPRVNLRTAILDGIERANERVADLGVGAATTLAVVEIDGYVVRPYHVGDSMMLVVGQRGKVKLATVSHSPVGYAVEAGYLGEAEAIHHADRHLVSNIVGSPEMRIEVGRTLALRPRDTLVLATDGLFDNLHRHEIIEQVRKGPLPAVAETLAAAGRRRMREPEPGQPSQPDDLTFLLFRTS